MTMQKCEEQFPPKMSQLIQIVHSLR